MRERPVKKKVYLLKIRFGKTGIKKTDIKINRPIEKQAQRKVYLEEIMCDGIAWIRTAAGSDSITPFDRAWFKALIQLRNW